MYHEITVKFTTNITREEDSKYIISRVNIKDIKFDSMFVNDLFNYKGENPSNFSYFFSFDQWSNKSNGFGFSEVTNIFNIKFQKRNL